MEVTQVEGRRLGNYERYSLARANAGTPIVCSYAARFPPSHRLDSLIIKEAVSTLLSRYPLLRAVLKDRRTREPRFEVSDSIHADQIVRAEESGQGLQELLLECVVGGEKFDLEKGPLWEVVNYRGPAGDTLVVSINHVISDGQSGRNLLSELLGLIHGETSFTTVNPSIPPSMEESIDFRPGYLHVAGVIFDALISPNLPSFLRPKTIPHYPPPVPSPPYQNTSELKLFTFPASTVAALKAAAKSRGVATLHPLLQTCILASFSLAVNKSSPSDEKTLFTSSSPKSLRDPSLNHPTVTGNYVSSITSKFHLSTSTSFWPLCQSYAAEILSPIEQKKAKWEMGMMSWIPDPPLKEGETETGWEKFVQERKDNERPFRATFELSNLGVMPKTGWEEEGIEVAFVQTASPVGVALCMNAMSLYGGGLSIVGSWRQNAIPPAVMESFKVVFPQVIEKIAFGGLRDPTFKELV